MKKQVLIAAVAILCSLIASNIDAQAQQIFNQFRQPTLVVGKPYRDINDCPLPAAAKQVIPPTYFTLPPVNTVDMDDGYAYIQFPADFRFNFNYVLRTGMYVSVNGFITFSAGKLVPAKQSAGLFTNSASYPDNVVAPYWGDHRLRTLLESAAGFMPSEISWVIDVDRNESCDTIFPVRRCLIVQWRNLNINDRTINSSVGNFQARFYEATSEDNFQGDIEFAYGRVGGNPYTENTIVVTRGATIGIKGDGGFPNYLADFWNGLRYEPALSANTATDSTSVWQPSGGRSDARIRFGSIVRFQWDGWGIGDADTSAARRARHDGRKQHIFVTANDARVIMKSIVTRKPLDSVWKRQAYLGDVNHNGRYYFTTLNPDFTCCSTNAAINPIPPYTVIWKRWIDVNQFTNKRVRRDMHESEGLFGFGGRAPDLSNLAQIYYEVTEYDAGLIMRYLSGRLPSLPWIRDNDTTGPDKGKITGENADNIRFGEPARMSDGSVTYPVYVNGSVIEAFGSHFAVDGNVRNVVVNGSANGSVYADFSSSSVVLVGEGSFDASSPIAFVTFDEKNQFDVSEIRFNDQKQPNQALNAGEIQSASLVAFPNPAYAETSFRAQVPNGEYTLSVFNSLGELVNRTSVQVSEGSLTYAWNGRNLAGQAVAPGRYVVSVGGNNVSYSTTLTIVK